MSQVAYQVAATIQATSPLATEDLEHLGARVMERLTSQYLLVTPMVGQPFILRLSDSFPAQVVSTGLN